MKIGRICSTYGDGSITRGCIIPQSFYHPVDTTDMVETFREWFEEIESPSNDDYTAACKMVENEISLLNLIQNKAKTIPTDLLEKHNVPSPSACDNKLDYLNCMKHYFTCVSKR